MLWMSGSFDHKSATIKDSLWLSGEFLMVILMVHILILG
jgi:hypothetical protein